MKEIMSESKKSPHLSKMVLDAVYSVFLQGVNILGWMVIIYLMLFIVIGGDFSISIKWENVRELWNSLNGI